jgi:hypothetical protein
MHPSLVLKLLCVCVHVCVWAAPAAPNTAYVGAFIGNNPTVKQMQTFNTATGTKHSLFHSFYDFPITNSTALTAFLGACGQVGAAALVTLQPQQVRQQCNTYACVQRSYDNGACQHRD